MFAARVLEKLSSFRYQIIVIAKVEASSEQVFLISVHETVLLGNELGTKLEILCR